LIWIVLVVPSCLFPLCACWSQPPCLEPIIDDEPVNFTHTIPRRPTKVNPVEYRQDSKRPLAKTSTLEEFLKSILYFLFSKSKEWKCEEEYRMILNYNKLHSSVITPPETYIKGIKVHVKKGPWKTLYFKKIPEEVISAIYIGCRAENKKEIIENFNQAKKTNPKLKNVKIYESILDPDYFKVIYREIHS